MTPRVRVTRSRSEERCSPFNVFPWASGHSTAIKSEHATGWRSWHSPVGVDRGKGVSSRCQCGQSKIGAPKEQGCRTVYQALKSGLGNVLGRLSLRFWRRLKECSSCGCGHWDVPWVRRTAGRASLGDRRAVLLKCSK